MPDNKRKGQRKPREQLLKRRVPELGYYFIITDTKETEQNYMFGLRDSIPKELQGKLVIKVSKTKTANLVNEAKSLAALQPQYGEPWIIFDKDQVKDFDEIIRLAGDENIHVGWSNPCIEIWFNAYFGTMPTYQDSVSCCNGFESEFEGKTSQKYKKSDDKIYEKLCQCGNEKEAIKIAKLKLAQHKRNCKNKPSEMFSGTTVHLLVEEIKNKIEKEQKCYG